MKPRAATTLPPRHSGDRREDGNDETVTTHEDIHA